jgi:hypothetical protein
VIPESDVTVTRENPAYSAFWVPTDDDVTEDEGFCAFRDTRLIYNCPASYAVKLVQEEARLIEIADRYSNSRNEFEQLARGLEWPDLEMSSLSEELKARRPGRTCSKASSVARNHLQTVSSSEFRAWRTLSRQRAF